MKRLFCRLTHVCILRQTTGWLCKALLLFCQVLVDPVNQRSRQFCIVNPENWAIKAVLTEILPHKNCILIYIMTINWTSNCAFHFRMSNDVPAFSVLKTGFDARVTDAFRPTVRLHFFCGFSMKLVTHLKMLPRALRRFSGLWTRWRGRVGVWNVLQQTLYGGEQHIGWTPQQYRWWGLSASQHWIPVDTAWKWEDASRAHWQWRNEAEQGKPDLVISQERQHQQQQSVQCRYRRQVRPTFLFFFTPFLI